MKRFKEVMFLEHQGCSPESDTDGGHRINYRGTASCRGPSTIKSCTFSRIEILPERKIVDSARASGPPNCSNDWSYTMANIDSNGSQPVSRLIYLNSNHRPYIVCVPTPFPLKMQVLGCIPRMVCDVNGMESRSIGLVKQQGLVEGSELKAFRRAG